MKAPWVPPKGDNFKGKQIEFQDQDNNNLQEAERMIRRDSIQKLFDGYYYDNSKRQVEVKALGSPKTLNLLCKKKQSLIEQAKQKALEQQEKSRNKNMQQQIANENKQFFIKRNLAIKQNQVKDIMSSKNRNGSPLFGSLQSNASTAIGSFKAQL